VIHPYLMDPAHAEAFAALVANGYGTQRGWARAWGWTLPRVQRFLAALVRYRLAEVTSASHVTVVRPIEADTTRGQSDTPNPIRPDTTRGQYRGQYRGQPVVTLGTGYLDKQPRELEGDLEAGSGYTGTLINCMNGVLSERFGQEYRPVMHDNRASVAAGERLQVAGIDIDFAVAELRGGCWLFNPSKHGHGELPRSLAYFERGTVKAWATRAQQQLALLSSSRGGAPTRSEPSRESGVPTPIADSIAELQKSMPQLDPQSWRAIYAANGGALPSGNPSS
jgi:hypothetical protein